MAEKRKRKRSVDLKRITRLTSLAFFVALVGAVGSASLFIMHTLNTVSEDSNGLGHEDLDIEKIDTTKLQAIRAALDAKTALDAPRAGELQNPFVTTPPPPPPAQPEEPPTAPEEDLVQPDALPAEANADAAPGEGT